MDSAELSPLQRRAAERDSPQTLQRTLSATQLTLMGVGAIIGAGIFVATGTVAAHNAGPAVVFSFILAAAACLCAGLCYAEFSAMAPASGSAYDYIYMTFGRLPAWLIGWCLILEYLTAAATVAVGWSAYLQGLLSSFGIAITLTPVVNLPAVGLLAVLTASLAAGVRLSTRINAVLVAIKLTVIALFVVCGARFVDPSHWQPFVPPNSGQFGEFGWSGVLRGAAAIFYAYLGFDAIAAGARETRDPQRSMPRGIIGSLLICTVVYIAFALVLTGLAPYQVLAAPNPTSAALDYAGERLHFLKLVIELGAVISLSSVVLVLLYAQSRVMYAMSRDGVVPALFGRVSTRSRSPLVSVVACGTAAAIAAAFLPAELLGQLISIGTLTAFVFVCAAVLVLRIRQPGLARPFRVRYAPFICVAGMATCIYLMAALPSATWQRFIGWLAIGTAIYALYGRRHTMVDRSNQRG